jgi:hypothetical protein
MCLRAIGLACVLVLCGAAPSYGQQRTGPRTLEGLLNSDEPQKPAAAAAEADATDAGPKRPAGTLVRPKDGVKHPDLDKAWTDYDAAVAKVTESIKAAIAKQFDAATAKGDLDAAEKWQVIGEKFEKAGELPTDKEAKTAVSAAVTDCKEAREELTKAYETVVKALTMEQKIAEAKAVREESRALSSDNHTPKPAVNLAKAGTPSANRFKPGNGDVRLAFDGITGDTDNNYTSYWYGGDSRPQPDWLRVGLKRPATIRQLRLLTPIGILRFGNGHEPVDYEVSILNNGKKQRVCRVANARHPNVEPVAGKENVRWIVIDLPKPVIADAVVLTVESTSGNNMGPVIFECEVLGTYEVDE